MMHAMRMEPRTRATAIGLLAGLLASALAPAQELVFSTGDEVSGPSPLIVFADLGSGLAGATPIYVAPTQPHEINPHGFALLGPTTAVAGKIPGFQTGPVDVDVIDIASASLIASFNPGGANDPSYSGYGTVIVNPAGSHLLLAAGSVAGGVNSSKLWVVPTPLSNLSVASDILTMPGKFGTAQTHAIAFDQTTGRAYVAHGSGITAIDPPYNAGSVAFTMALPVLGSSSGLSRSVALSPDKSTLLTTTGGGSPGVNLVTILHAPFSAGSAHEDLTVAHALLLGAVAFTPDGTQALVVDQQVPNTLQGQVFAVAAPYSASASVEWLQFPPGGANLGGFEDLEVSPNGEVAALGGGCAGAGCPLAILHAPFTATGFSVETMDVPLLPYPYYSSGRGAGAVHFWPAPIAPLPQISIDRISVTEGNSGTKPATFTLSLSNPSTQTVSVDYATVDSTAQAGSDYVAISGTLNFAPGQTHRTIAVPVSGDTLGEADEPFRLGLSNPVNASLLYSPLGYDGVCVIVDDDSGNRYIINDSPLPDATVGAPYAQTFTLANYAGTPSWGVDSPNLYLPGGLAMDTASGALAGTPTQAGSYYFYVYAAGLNVTREYHLTVRSDRIFANGFESLP